MTRREELIKDYTIICGLLRTIHRFKIHDMTKDTQTITKVANLLTDAYDE